MKHRIPALLCAAVLAFTLAACNSAPSGEDTTTAEPVTETTAAPAPDVVLAADGATQYVIVRSEEGSKAATECAVSLRKYMEACGLKPKITTDWEKNPVSDYEIIVGETTRCADAGIDIHDLGEEGYTIRAVGTKLYIVGGSDAATSLAVEKFMTDFMGYTGDPAVASAITSLTVPAGYNETVTQTYALEKITVAGTDLEEFVLVAPDRNLKKVAEQIQARLYTACGVWLEIVEEKAAGHNILMLSEAASKPDNFEVTVENGNLVMRSSVNNGVSRGIGGFLGSLLRDAEGTLALDASYKYENDIGAYVTYSEFGAVGDGKANDFNAIVKAHEYANANKMEIRADEGAVYYIGSRSTTAIIQTNVDWTGATFIIDDTKIDLNQRSTHTFRVSREDTKGIGLKNLGLKTLTVNQQKLELSEALPGPCYVVVQDDSTKNFIRKGANQNSGSSQTDCFLVSADGTVDPTTPIIWDFNNLSSAVAFPLEEETITIKGGTITTIANQQESKYNYYTTGIEVMRSNVVIDGLVHYVEGELDHGAPYNGIVQVNKCANVTIQNGTFTAHKIYATIGAAGTSVNMGSYDLRCNRAINVLYKNCVQTTDILDTKYWGIFCSDYCKNLTLDGCSFSRFDAHMGVTNATIKNSTLGHQCLNAIGHGLLTVENSTLYGSSFINLRSDYGSTWNGDVVIRNCVWIPNKGIGTGAQVSLIGASNDCTHDFGYECYMPQNITIDGLTVTEGRTGAVYKGIYILPNATSGWTSEAFEKKMLKEGKSLYHVTKTVTISNFVSEKGKKWNLSLNPYMFRDVVVNDLDAAN